MGESKFLISYYPTNPVIKHEFKQSIWKQQKETGINGVRIPTTAKYYSHRCPWSNSNITQSHEMVYSPWKTTFALSFHFFRKKEEWRRLQRKDHEAISNLGSKFRPDLILAIVVTLQPCKPSQEKEWTERERSCII